MTPFLDGLIEWARMEKLAEQAEKDSNDFELIQKMKEDYDKANR